MSEVTGNQSKVLLLRGFHHHETFDGFDKFWIYIVEMRQNLSNYILVCNERQVVGNVGRKNSSTLFVEHFCIQCSRLREIVVFTQIESTSKAGKLLLVLQELSVELFELDARHVVRNVAMIVAIEAD